MGSPNPISRGAFIVFEGLDRCGKSTQISRLVQHLTSQDVPVEQIAFPNRETITGKKINSYLTNKTNLPDDQIHKLFADNRWEMQTQMQEYLLSGKTLVVDRYSYSGVAYTAAKKIDFDWCKGTEVGLIKPDLVIYLEGDVEKLVSRGDYGEERYERVDFQRNVSSIFDRLYKDEMDYWRKIDACQDAETVQRLVVAEVEPVISRVKETPINKLWEKS